MQALLCPVLFPTTMHHTWLNILDVESWSIVSWKRCIKIIKSDPWFLTGHPKNPALFEIVVQTPLELLQLGGCCPEQSVPCPSPPAEEPFPVTQPGLPLPHLHRSLMFYRCYQSKDQHCPVLLFVRKLKTAMRPSLILLQAEQCIHTHIAVHTH